MADQPSKTCTPSQNYHVMRNPILSILIATPLFFGQPGIAANADLALQRDSPGEIGDIQALRAAIDISSLDDPAKGREELQRLFQTRHVKAKSTPDAIIYRISKNGPCPSQNLEVTLSVAFVDHDPSRKKLTMHARLSESSDASKKAFERSWAAIKRLTVPDPHQMPQLRTFSYSLGDPSRGDITLTTNTAEEIILLDYKE